jgi:phospholipid/cholesterol/gamma-HCH transport system substrate-binding protein
VGLLIAVFAALLFGAYRFLGRSLFAEKADTYFVLLPDASGVQDGAPVLLAGVRIGRVSSVDLVDPRTARLTLSIREGRRIPQGSRAMVPTPLIGFGDNPVLIVPPREVQAAFMRPGQTMQGTKASALDGAFPELKVTVDELNKTLLATRALVSDSELRNDLAALMEHSAAAVQKLGGLASSAQGLIASNRASISQAMTSLAATMRDVQEGARLATELLRDDRWRKEADALLAQLNQTTAKAQELMTSLNDMVNDPALRDPLRVTAANVQAITDSGTRVAANSEEITKNGVAISKNVEELTRKANELADQAKEVLGKLQQFFERVPSSGAVKGLETEMSLVRQSDPAHWRTDLSASIPVSDGRFHAGIYDAFETNRLILQYAKPVSPKIDFRYGIFASKPGLGVDSRFSPRLSFRGDLYDINDPTLDLRLRYDLGKGLLGWAGIEKVFDNNVIAIGVGIRK